MHGRNATLSNCLIDFIDFKLFLYCDWSNCQTYAPHGFESLHVSIYVLLLQKNLSFWRYHGALGPLGRPSSSVPWWIRTVPSVATETSFGQGSAFVQNHFQRTGQTECPIIIPHLWRKISPYGFVYPVVISCSLLYPMAISYSHSYLWLHLPLGCAISCFL